jgi:hypothetical protein
VVFGPVRLCYLVGAVGWEVDALCRWRQRDLCLGKRHVQSPALQYARSLNPSTFRSGGYACGTESTNPANDRRYASVGFEPHGEFCYPRGGPVVTTMWRPAR